MTNPKARFMAHFLCRQNFGLRHSNVLKMPSTACCHFLGLIDPARILFIGVNDMKLAIFIFTVFWAALLVPVLFICLFFFGMSFDNPHDMTSIGAWIIRLAILLVPLLFSLGFLLSFKVRFTFAQWILLIVCIGLVWAAMGLKLLTVQQENMRRDEAEYNRGAAERLKRQKAENEDARKYNELLEMGDAVVNKYEELLDVDEIAARKYEEKMLKIKHASKD